MLETETPAGQEPLEWLLVSSEGGGTAERAERIVRWYEALWGIEEYFGVLKTGTRIEDWRLQEADVPVKCLAFDAVTAWQVFTLDRYARDAPGTPAADVLSEGEREEIGIVVLAEWLLLPANVSGHSWRTSGAGSCYWDASRAGGRRSDARFPATMCFCALACKCRTCCASGRPRVLPDHRCVNDCGGALGSDDCHRAVVRRGSCSHFAGVLN